MFNDINVVSFSGRMRDKPIVKEVKKGFLLKFILVINSSYKVGPVYKKHATYAVCQIRYKRNPEKVVRYFNKGNRLWVTGNLAYNTIITPNGPKNYMYYNIKNWEVLEEKVLTEGEIKEEEEEELFEQEMDTFNEFDVFDNDDI